MSVQLTWQTSPTASALWGAQCIALGRQLADPQLSAALAEPARQLSAGLTAQGLPVDEFWRWMLPASAERTGALAGVERALVKAVGRARAAVAAPQLAGLVEAVEQALPRAFPRFAEELELRLHPCRQQWEARGPGLLAVMRRLSEAELFPAAATVILVQPCSGGGGEAFASSNLAIIEALLTDADPRLPEVIRLGWLLAQLNLDLPRYSDQLPRDRLRRAARLGLVPLALAAAEEAELAQFDRAGIELALRLWGLETLATADCGELATMLESWRQEYLASRPPLPIAFAGLDALLEPK